jgi:hypothetical protein
MSERKETINLKKAATAKNRNKDAFLIRKSDYEFYKLLDRKQQATLLDAIFEYQESGKIIKMDLPIELVFMHLKSRWNEDNEQGGGYNE